MPVSSWSRYTVHTHIRVQWFWIADLSFIFRKGVWSLKQNYWIGFFKLMYCRPFLFGVKNLFLKSPSKFKNLFSSCDRCVGFIPLIRSNALLACFFAFKDGVYQEFQLNVLRDLDKFFNEKNQRWKNQRQKISWHCPFLKTVWSTSPNPYLQ
jgi:hypothetical protein